MGLGLEEKGQDKKGTEIDKKVGMEVYNILQSLVVPSCPILTIGSILHSLCCWSPKRRSELDRDSSGESRSCLGTRSKSIESIRQRKWIRIQQRIDSICISQ